MPSISPSHPPASALGTVRALENWQHVELPRAGGVPLRVTGVPARHGPPGCEPVTGPVTGFVLTGDGLPTVYVSGDNAAPEHAGAVADRFGPVVAGRQRYRVEHRPDRSVAGPRLVVVALDYSRE